MGQYIDLSCMPSNDVLTAQRDPLGWRMKFGVVAPATNTTVQPEFDAMRPMGVTNQHSRIPMPDLTIDDDASYMRVMDVIRAGLEPALKAVMPCKPDHIIMGMSAETFWDGIDGSKRLQERIETDSGLKVTMGSDACQAALRVYGVRSIAVVTPYQPVGDAQVQGFFADCGFEVRQVIGLKCPSPNLIAHVPPKHLRAALLQLDKTNADALVQVGTNLSMARLAGEAEFWLDRPVIAINAATYWHALRSTGIADPVAGFGSLLLHH